MPLCSYFRSVLEGEPHILFGVDRHEIYKKVQEFRDKYKDRGICFTYSSDEEFKTLFFARKVFKKELAKRRFTDYNIQC